MRKKLKCKLRYPLHLLCTPSEPRAEDWNEVSFVEFFNEQTAHRQDIKK